MRYHINTASAGSLSSYSARLPAALSDIQAAVVSAATTVTGPTVYTGAAGVAYALTRAARAQPALLPTALQQVAAAARADLRWRVAESVMDGHAGIAAVEAIVTR